MAGDKERIDPMTSDDRQFLLTAAWLFMRHGKRSRALAVCEALIEDNPRDGVSACALAELLLDQSVSVWAYPALVLSKNVVPWIVSDRFPPCCVFSPSPTAHLVFVT